jgi:hypothetical protein
MTPELRPDVSPDTAGLTITHVDPASLKPNRRNARTHSKKQIGKIADSIKAFGFAVRSSSTSTGRCWRAMVG